MNNDLETHVVNSQLELVRGDDEGLELLFTDEENENQPIDITGYTIFLTLKQDRKDADEDALLQVIVTEHPHALEGKAVISVSEEKWETGYKGNPVPSGQCQFDVQFIEPDAELPKTILIGDCVVVQDVTHGVTA